MNLNTKMTLYNEKKTLPLSNSRCPHLRWHDLRQKHPNSRKLQEQKWELHWGKSVVSLLLENVTGKEGIFEYVPNITRVIHLLPIEYTIKDYEIVLKLERINWRSQGTDSIKRNIGVHPSVWALTERNAVFCRLAIKIRQGWGTGKLLFKNILLI